MRAVLISLGVLAAAAAAQTVIFLESGSVALLADLIHNYGDALTAIPLMIAFLMRSARAERAAGLFVVAAIFISACVAGYEAISSAPPPSERYRQFLALEYPRKIVTVEPVMDFDVDVFASWIINIKPELVYLGLNSKTKPRLPEPSPDKLVTFAKLVSAAGIPIVGKTLRGLELPGGS